MSNLGDYYSGCTVFDIFTTVDTQGRPTTLAGNPVPFLVVYKDAFVTGGYCTVIGAVLARDCNGLLGVNAWSVATNQSATFYACGHDYQVLLIGGCVDSLCVSGYVVGRFSLKNRAVLRPTVHARDLDVSATGEAGVDWANVGSPTTAVGLSCTTSFSVQSVVNSVGVPACTAIFSVTSVTNSVNTAITEQGIACTIWNSLQTNYDVCGSFGTLLDCRTGALLQSRIPGRKLDVDASGHAGIDWANVNNCTTANALSCTTIFSVQSVVNSVASTVDVGFTEQSLACTVWNSLQANYDVCGSFGTLLDCKTSAALQPTTPGRRLDISSGGAAGVDWANVESPTTAVGLDCTTLFSTQSVVNSVGVPACTAIFSVQSVLNSVGVPACTTIFSVQSVLNSVGINPCSTVFRVETLSNTAVSSIVDVAITEPSGVFAWASATLRNILGWLGAVTSDCLQQTSTTQTLRDRANAVTIATSPLTCEATTVHRGSFS